MFRLFAQMGVALAKHCAESSSNTTARPCSLTLARWASNGRTKASAIPLLCEPISRLWLDRTRELAASRKHSFLRCRLRFGVVLGLTLCAGLRFLGQQAGMQAIHAEKRGAAQFEYVGHAG